MNSRLKHAQAIRQHKEILGLASVDPEMAMVLKILWQAHILVPSRPYWGDYVAKLKMFAKHMPREYLGG